MKAWSLRYELARASFLTTLLALTLTASSLLLYELATYRNALVTDIRTLVHAVHRS